MARSPSDTDVFTAVAEPRRRDILEVLAAHEQPVGDLVAALDLSQPIVSKHLRVLREVGLVQARDVGRQRLYRVNGHALVPLVDWLRRFEQLWEQRFEAIDEILSGPDESDSDPSRPAVPGSIVRDPRQPSAENSPPSQEDKP